MVRTPPQLLIYLLQLLCGCAVSAAPVSSFADKDWASEAIRSLSSCMVGDIIPVLGKLRQEGCRIESSLKTNKQKSEKTKRGYFPSISRTGNKLRGGV